MRSVDAAFALPRAPRPHDNPGMVLPFDPAPVTPRLLLANACRARRAPDTGFEARRPGWHGRGAEPAA